MEQKYTLNISEEYVALCIHFLQCNMDTFTEANFKSMNISTY